MVQFIKTDHLPKNPTALPHKLVPFIWHFLKQVWPPFLLVGVLSGIADIIATFIPYYIKILVDGFTQTENPAEIWDVLFWPIVSFGALVLVLKPVSERLGQWLMAWLRPAFNNMMCRQLALYMHGHSYNYFQNDFAGRLASKVIETPNAIAMIVQMLLGSIWMMLIRMIVSLGLFWSVHWIFGALGLFWILSYGLVAWYFIPKIMYSSKRMYDDKSIVRGRYVDTLTNIMTVKLFARRKHEDDYLLEALKKNTKSGQKMFLIGNAKNICVEIIISIFLGGAFLASVMLWQNGTITTGDVAMVIPLALGLTNMATWMIHALASFFESIGQVKEGMETILKGQDVLDDSGAKKLNVQRGKIEFDHVDFSYGAKPVFEDFSLEIKPGEKIGLVGPSGAGKSTFMSLLLRLFDVQEGKIVIDDQIIRNVTQESLRENIAVIAQSSDLMHRSVRDNISYGRLDATDDEIIAAAKKANAHDFIAGLIDNKGNKAYDAFVGERGVKLSGGQKQRIAIARAILKDAPILVLDEATSSLDSESESLIQNSLFELMEGKTVVAIAHRLSTLTQMDRLIVLQDGKIIESGSHTELLKLNGYYARLWAMQSGGFMCYDEDSEQEAV